MKLRYDASMKLARNLTVALVLGVFAVLAVSAYLRARRETGVFENDVRHDDHIMGRALAAAVLGVWRTEGETRALRVVEEANERESQVDIRWVWLDPQDDERRVPTLPATLLAPIRNGKEVVSKIQRDGVDRIVTCVPVPVPDVRTGAIELSESLAGERQYLRRTIINTLVDTALLTFVCGIITTVLGVWLVGRPMRDVIEQARRIGAGDLTRRLSVRKGDEIGELGAEMNRMCDRLAAAHDKLAAETGARIETLEQLRHAERLATVGKLASGVAHELGTPLQIVTGRARMLADRELDLDEAVANGRILLEQSQRMTQIIRQLLDFARRRTAEKLDTDLRQLVRETCSLLMPLAEKQRVTIAHLGPAAPLHVHVDREQIRQALANVIVNGIQAMPGGGKLTVRVRVGRVRPPADHGGAEGEYVALSVEDQGEGMEKKTMDHVFEPFFTTKPVGEGTGLGLSVAYGIVKEHGGWIHVQSQPSKSAQFILYLPTEQAS